ncbi:class F sortase [Aquipuribacter sp. MA13-6]|uniref:class F sortase n=1 Tax=unclassified Aquipuribacter TaxID=2635084 RepID=UPI003EEAE123
MTATPPPTEPAAPAAPVARRRSRWTAVVVAVAVAAVLAPVAWLTSRPAPDAGLPLEQALAAAPTTAPDPTGPQPTGPQPTGPQPTGPPTPEDPPPAAVPPSPFGDVGVRDASLDSLAASSGPAPTRLLVDGLGIDAAVDAVGVEDDGSMVVPAEIDRVGWYQFGPAAGAPQGNAVLAGHVDAAGEGPGALFELRGVEVGAVLTVVDETGVEHHYEVVGRETIVKDVLPVDDIFARDGEHRLVVVTCGGPFIPELSSYRDNVVVTAVPVDAA